MSLFTTPEKRGRGRPRKIPRVPDKVFCSIDGDDESEDLGDAPSYPICMPCINFHLTNAMHRPPLEECARRHTYEECMAMIKASAARREKAFPRMDSGEFLLPANVAIRTCVRSHMDIKRNPIDRDTYTLELVYNIDNGGRRVWNIYVYARLLNDAVRVFNLSLQAHSVPQNHEIPRSPVPLEALDARIASYLTRDVIRTFFDNPIQNCGTLIEAFSRCFFVREQ